MKQITCVELRQRLLKGEFILLADVREQHEHEAFNIGGIVAPLSNLIRHVDKIATDKEVIVYCKKGIRSQIAIQRLEEKLGFANLVNLQGGMDAWKKLP